MKKFKVDVQYSLTTAFIIQADDETQAMKNLLNKLKPKNVRGANQNRKAKVLFKDIGITDCNICGAPEDTPRKYEVKFTATATQSCLVNCPDTASAEALAEGQIAQSYRPRAGQVSFATNITAVKTQEVKK